MIHMTPLLAVLLAQTTVPATGPDSYTVDAQKSSVRYGIVHKFHKVHGESKVVQGKALLKSDGTLQAMVRIPIGTFMSGDGNRDAHMRECMEEPKYPYVVYKGVAKLPNGTSTLPPKLDLTLDGELDFHGRKHPERVKLRVDASNPESVRVTGRFVVSLDRYQVERPSLLLIKIDDECTIDLDLTLKRGEH
jgi:polyisoprenoid-binding protein YceI